MLYLKSFKIYEHLKIWYYLCIKRLGDFSYLKTTKYTLKYASKNLLFIEIIFVLRILAQKIIYSSMMTFSISDIKLIN